MRGAVEALPLRHGDQESQRQGDREHTEEGGEREYRQIWELYHSQGVQVTK